MVPDGQTRAVKTLREWRAYRRLSKAEIAKVLGVHPSTYSRMETRPADITVKEATILADVLTCEVGEINFFD
ncbi:helix-turn-helix protein [compost metagenome]